jgi:hypothetical protein
MNDLFTTGAAPMKKREIMNDWRSLNDSLHALTEREVMALLAMETQGARRKVFLIRLHQRMCALRAVRERAELLKAAA